MTYKAKHLSLRPASIDDANILFQWRNNIETRIASHINNKINWDEHIKWLKLTLENKNKKLFIAEEHGIAVGTVRAEYADNACKLSWTVSPDTRGKGIGKKMLGLLANKINEPIHAEIKKGNEASSRIAEHSGMKLVREDNNILYYQRDEINQKHNA